MLRNLIISMLFLSASPSIADNLRLYQNIDYSPELLGELCLFELCLLRNEVFAVHGYIFSSIWLDAHFKGQDWYSPVEGCCSGGDQYPDFSSQENSNIQLFREMEEGFGKTIYSCWTRENTSSFDYEYYRNVTSEQPAPSVIDDFDRFTDFPMELGSHPCVSSEDLLPFEQFSALYENSGYRSERMIEDNDFREAQEEILETLAADFDLTGYCVYRVYRRSDGSIARVEKVEMFDEPFPMEPDWMWSAYFDPDGSLVAFRPWCTLTGRSFFMLYGADGDRTVLRAAVQANYLEYIIEMEIFDGPYPVLPFKVILCDEENYFEESRFRMLTGRR